MGKDVNTKGSTKAVNLTCNKNVNYNALVCNSASITMANTEVFNNTCVVRRG